MSPPRRIPRVFLGVTEISGYYRGLRQGFHDIGVPCTLALLEDHPFGFGDPDPSALASAIRRCKRARADASPLRRAAISPAELALRAALTLRAAATHDAFVFSFATTALRGLDLPLLRAMGKTVILQYHGSDSRPVYLGGHAPDDPAALAAAALAQRRRVQRLDRHAHAVVDIPPQAHFHERPYINWLRVGLPVRPADAADTCPPPRRPADTLVALHSPSNPKTKGSQRIRDAVSALRAEGLPIELRELTGRPNAEIIDAIRRADLVIDQAYADYPMPGLACEAAWLGRPVVIAGYETDLWRALLPPDAHPPTAYVHPDDLKPTIERLAKDPNARRRLAERAHAFVAERWNPAAVARRYLRVIRGDTPDDWLIRPGEHPTTHGCGVEERALRDRLATLIRARGPGALALDHNPTARDRLIAFARAAPPTAPSPNQVRPAPGFTDQPGG